jgi:hypothetical protein
MPKFVAIGYGDRKGYGSTQVSIRNAAHAHDAQLLEAGAVMGVTSTPVQVRNPDATKIEIRNGPFMTSSVRCGPRRRRGVAAGRSKIEIP